MKKILGISLMLSVLFVGCKKETADTADKGLQNLENDVEGSARSRNPKCDFSEAISKSISDDGTQLQSLFKKYYKGNSTKLDKIMVSFRNVAAPGGNNITTMKVQYKYGKMIFLNESNSDTMVVLNFDPSGKLVKAEAGMPIYAGWSGKIGFRFFYHQNRLSSIESSELVYLGDDNYDTTWIPYIRLKYDYSKANVSEVEFRAFGEEPGTSIKYKYNYSRKVKYQVYPDDMMGDYHYFFYFLKYLNLFPELTPSHLLIESQTNNIVYPGDYRREYSHHHIDSDGRLIFYKQRSIIDMEQSRNTSSEGYIEWWKINWKCSNGGQHSYHNEP
jgi:hypothetical protein